MKLSFLAKEDLLVCVPGAIKVVGQPTSYVGRRFDAATRSYPAVAEPFECDSESPAGQRLIKLMARENSLLPADIETAKFFKIEFKKLTLGDGVIVPELKKASK